MSQGSPELDSLLARFEIYRHGKCDGREEGKALGLTKAILRILETRFPDESPPELTQQLQFFKNPVPELEYLLDVALDADSFGEFHRALLPLLPPSLVAKERKVSRSRKAPPTGLGVGHKATGITSAQKRKSLPRGRKQ